MSVSGTDKSMRTPLARARGLGSAKDGVNHWWMQRLTAVALALLTPWFLWQMVFLPHVHCQTANSITFCGGFAVVNVRDLLKTPSHALPLLAFALALFWHAKLGLQVVIEDYVHTRWVEIVLQVTTTFACAIGALASVFAILRIVLAP